MYKLFISFSLLLLAACNNPAQNNSATLAEGATEGSVHAGAADTLVTGAQPLVLDGCYEMTMKKDTFFLQLNVKDSLVSGVLHFDFFEKDSNKGTLTGVLRGNKIIADYAFQSEGISSVREVVFQIQDKTLLQGFGELEEKDGKLVFENRDQLQYQTNNPYIKIACP